VDTGKRQHYILLQSSGRNQAEIFASATGKAEFSVANGTSRALLLDSTKLLNSSHSRENWDLIVRFDIAPSKLKADKRIYTLNGTVSLADKTTNLKA